MLFVHLTNLHSNIHVFNWLENWSNYLWIILSLFFSFCPYFFQYEMLTGQLPFQGKDRKDTMTQILK